MTVEQLIKILSDYNPTWEVRYSDREYSYWMEITEIVPEILRNTEKGVPLSEPIRFISIA